MPSRRADEGVSSVVGTILMLAITVAVFGGFSVVALGYVQGQPEPVRAELAAVSSEDSLLFTHQGGESFVPVGSTLYVNVDGYEESFVLDDAGLAARGSPTLAQLGLDDGWDVGDTLCVWGQGDLCLYDPDDVAVEGAFFVDDGRLLADEGERGSTGTPRRDLVPSLVSQAPATPGAGQAITWTVRVTNDGADRVWRSALPVRVEVDGVQVATATASGPLLPGASAIAVTAPGWAGTAGTHTLRVALDPLDAVVETDEANNVLSVDFTVLAGVEDPGTPFVDANGDGLYTPGTDSTITASDVQDGSFDAGAGSLVLPESIGDIAADAVSFTAGGDITINVEVTSVNAPMTLDAGGDLVLGSANLLALQNNDDLTLIAGGDIHGVGLVASVNGGLVVTAGGVVNFTGAQLTVTSSNDPMSITGASIVLDGATLANHGNSGNTIAVTSTAGAISATAVTARSGGSLAWKSTGAGIDLSSSTLEATAGSLMACLASATADGLALSGTLSFTDGDGRLDAQRGAACNQDAAADAYVTPWPAAATDPPRSKLA